jgi:negative regulator of flagellin synthesis FlgM
LEIAMKIGPTPEQPVTQTATHGDQPVGDAARALAAETAAAPPVPAAGTKVELSSTASTLLSSGVNAEFDAQKVARVSQAIDNGSFKINPEAIADKLIANAQELLTQATKA